MKRIGFVGIILFLGLAGNGFSEEAVTNSQILEKLNSMDVKIARLETKVEEGQKSLQKQIDISREEMRAGQQSLQSQIDGLRYLVIGGFGVILAGMFALVGFVIWDRRTALAPAVKKIEKIEMLEKKEDRLEDALKEFAQKEPRLAEALRFAGVL